MCYSQECLNIRSHYSDPTKFKCEHLQACKESFQQATLVEIELTNITKYVRSELLLCELKEKENNGKFSVHVLPDKNVVLSLLQKRSHQCPSGLIHIDLAKFKCPVKKCDNLPKGHYLVKSKQMCIHVLICKYRVRQRGCSLTHSARTPPAVHPRITIWVDEIELKKKKKKKKIMSIFFVFKRN